MRRTASAAFIALTALIVAAVLVVALRSAHGKIEAVSVRWEYAALSLVPMAAFALVYSVCWAGILAALQRQPVRRGAVMRLFLITWPGRYVPGGLPHYGARLAAAPRLGLTRTVVAASLVYENLLTIAAAGGMSLAFLAIAHRQQFDNGPWVAACLAAVVVTVAAMHPAVVTRAVGVGARRVSLLKPLEGAVLDTRSLARMVGGYAVGSVCAGLTFWLSVLATGESMSLMTAIAVYNMAGVAGMLAVVVPSGAGIREGVVVGLLTGIVPPHVALAAAIIARVAGIVADLLLAAIVIAYTMVRRVPTRRRANLAVAAARSAR
jgi:uncharacterized membrane protein YbhN (UPF0104 family)